LPVGQVVEKKKWGEFFFEKPIFPILTIDMRDESGILRLDKGVFRPILTQFSLSEAAARSPEQITSQKVIVNSCRSSGSQFRPFPVRRMFLSGSHRDSPFANFLTSLFCTFDID
jgi:hypothetical protein